MSDFRVLLVDDEEELVSTLVERLEYRGVAAEYAINGTEALKKLRDSSFDVVVIDLKLPGMSGEELLHIVSKSYPGLPLLIITGHGAIANREFKKPEAAYDFLPKPIEITELIKKMKEAIKASELGRQN